MLYRIIWQEKDGSFNKSLIQTDKLSKAVAYIEQDNRCAYVCSTEIAEEK